MKQLLIAVTLMIFLAINGTNCIWACDKSKTKDNQGQSGQNPEEKIKIKEHSPKEPKEEVNKYNKDESKNLKKK